MPSTGRKGARPASGALVAALVAVAVLAAGCQRGLVTATVDGRDSLDRSVTEGRYDAGAGSALERRTDPARIRIPERLRSGDVEAVGAEFEIAYTHDLGAARAGVSVYAADSPAAVYDSPPVLAFALDLVPGIERRLARRIAGDSRLLDLVRHDSLYLGFELRWTPAGGDSIAGRYGITRLCLDVTSRLGGIEASSGEAPPAPELPR